MIAFYWFQCMDLGFHNCISRALRMQVSADEGRARALQHGADALSSKFYFCLISKYFQFNWFLEPFMVFCFLFTAGSFNVKKCSHVDNTEDRTILSCPGSVNSPDRAGQDYGTIQRYECSSNGELCKNGYTMTGYVRV